MIYNKTFEKIRKDLDISEFLNIDELSKHYKSDVYEILIFLIHHGIIEIDKDGFRLTKIGKDFIEGDEHIQYCKFHPIISNMILYDLLFSNNKYDIELCKKLERIYYGDIIKEYHIENKFEINIKI
jgi:hypothetical protein